MIYCFSGTGNTLYAARLLAQSLGDTIHLFTADELREPQNCILECEDDIIVWMFPTYSWGVPPVMRNIFRHATLRFAPAARHIAVTTCGDDIGNLAHMFRADLEKRGLSPGAVFSVQMPNTYVMMKGFDVDSESLARQKIEASTFRIDEIANAINDGHTSPHQDLVVRGSFPVFKTRLIYPWFVRHEMNPDGFRVDVNTCVSCGRCAASCPMSNITYDSDNHPVWGDKCAFCTACYHICPTHAIAWKRTTLQKGQYRNPFNLK